MASEITFHLDAASGDDNLDPRQARIVAVDNEPSILAMLQKVLTAAGFEPIETFTDSSKAMARLRGTPPDLLLLDLYMQQPDGFAILEELERLPELRHMPVLVITGDHSVDTQQRTMTGGPRDVLTKPFDPREVVLRVQNLLRLSLQQRQLRGELAATKERLQKVQQELNHSYVETVTRLRAVADSIGEVSAHHHLRVAELSELIAEEMGLPKNSVTIIRHATTLHDIGKALTRPGQDQESDHTRRGAALLGSSRSPFLRVGQQIALAHHEHWDGSGTPQGLAGAAIPVAARIAAVANRFDHLTHPADGSASLPREEALARIQENSGSWFDPDVVAALASVVPHIQADLVGSYLRRSD